MGVGVYSEARIHNMIQHEEHEFTCNVLYPMSMNQFWRDKMSFDAEFIFIQHVELFSVY